MKRDVIFWGPTQKTIDSWEGIDEMVKTNLQSLQNNSAIHSFSELPDWVNQGKVTDKMLKGGGLKGARQLTIKDQDSYRVVYIAEYPEYIVVLHAFKKKTEGKDSRAMSTVEARLRQVKAEIAAGRL